jgi:hypothetical protein
VLGDVSGGEKSGSLAGIPILERKRYSLVYRGSGSTKSLGSLSTITTGGMSFCVYPLNQSSVVVTFGNAPPLVGGCLECGWRGGTAAVIKKSGVYTSGVRGCIRHA